MIHKLLQRQLKRLGLSLEAPPPTPAEWEQLLLKISKAYSEADQDRYLLERSLKKSSDEMQERWQTVRSLEEQWRSLGECAPDLILMVDLSGKITFANRGRGDLAKEQLIGLELRSLYQRPNFPEAEECFLKASQNSKSRFEFLNVSPGGEELWFSQRFSPVEKDGKVNAILVVETEITEQMRMHFELEAERARATNAAKFATLGEMAGGIAHEINTPLSTIQILASLIRSAVKTEPVKTPSVISAVERIEATVERISKIIRGLRTFARQSDDDPFSQASLAKIVDETLALMSEKLKILEIKVTIDPGPEDILVLCRPTQIAQIVMNLCGNSLDAVKDQPEKWIEISIRGTDEQAELTVTDSGHGIPTAIREKIMQPFFTTKEVGKGTGLGLSISRGIAGQHNGLLYVDEKCPNTRFVLKLPRLRNAKAA